ncbi:hypothetical protein ZEAMMB73_Zm00001d032053 [Zea mays]|jgi:hypothetical protein|uniref:Uncharacterized protein n=1 Tax=Zea mays TaxID=4577 RepID=A0A1D6KNA8_MAIZE|nr:hypothetical protein ZEAMMB73_Zm00001d032053 [Zea mays]
MAVPPNRTPSLHGSSRPSSDAMLPPPALAKKDAQDTLFAEEEFKALQNGQRESPSFSANNLLQSSLLFRQIQAHLLCMDDLDDPISDDHIERPAEQFSSPRTNDQAGKKSMSSPPWPSCIADDDDEDPRPHWDDQAGKKRMSSPPWPSCIADDDDEDPKPRWDDQAGKKRMSSPPWPSCIADDDDEDPRPRSDDQASKKRMSSPPWPSCIADDDDEDTPPPIKKARTKPKSRSKRKHAAARATRLQLRREHRLQRWHNTIATLILKRRFRAPELSHGRTALRCLCPDLKLADDDPRGFGCCALHQDALPGHRAWMYSDEGDAPPLIGGLGEVLVPRLSAGYSKEEVRQYARWRGSVSMPSRFYVQQRAMEKGARSVA